MRPVGLFHSVYLIHPYMPTWLIQTYIYRGRKGGERGRERGGGEGGREGEREAEGEGEGEGESLL
jgi:hypothetical protein